MVKLNKSLIFVLMLAISVVSVLAIEPSYIFKQGVDINLKIFCFNETNSICDSTTLCNITILKPDNSVLVSNEQMSYNESFFNKTLTPAQTDILGEYTAMVNCLGTSVGYSTFIYKITYDGKDRTKEIFPIVIIISLLFIAGLGAFFTYYLDNELKFFCLLGTLLSGVFIMYTVASLAEASGVLESVVHLLWFAYSISLVLFFFIVLYVFWKLLTALRIKKNPPPNISSPLRRFKEERKMRKNGYNY